MVKRMMLWLLRFGIIISGLAMCLGTWAGTQESRTYDERSYWLLLTIIVIIFFFKMVEWEKEEKKKLDSLKTLSDKELEEIKKEV